MYGKEPAVCRRLLLTFKGYGIPPLKIQICFFAPVSEALIAAYKGSIHTILTSGTIMVLITAVIRPLFGTPPLSPLVRSLSGGCASPLFLFPFPPPRFLSFFVQAVGVKNTKHKTG